MQAKELKYYVAFKRIKNFACVEIHPQTGALLVFVKVDASSIELVPEFTRDVSNIGHYGTGDLEIRIESRVDFVRAQPLLLKSYEAS